MILTIHVYSISFFHSIVILYPCQGLVFHLLILLYSSLLSLNDSYCFDSQLLILFTLTVCIFELFLAIYVFLSLSYITFWSSRIFISYICFFTSCWSLVGFNCKLNSYNLCGIFTLHLQVHTFLNIYYCISLAFLNSPSDYFINIYILPCFDNQ